MIPLFVKVRPYVAERLGLSVLRFKTLDGNYILCQADFIPFGPLSRLKDYVARVGGVILQDKEAAAEEHDKNITPAALPTPTDPAWSIPESENEPEGTPQTTDGDTVGARYIAPTEESSEQESEENS